MELDRFTLATGGGERSGPNTSQRFLFSFMLGVRCGLGWGVQCVGWTWSEIAANVAGHYVSQQCQHALVCLENHACKFKNNTGCEWKIACDFYLFRNNIILEDLHWNECVSRRFILAHQAEALPKCLVTYSLLCNFKNFQGWGGNLDYLLGCSGSASACIRKEDFVKLYLKSP